MPWPKLWSSSTKDDKPPDKAIDERVYETIDSAIGNVTATAASLKDGQASATGYAVWQVFRQPQTLFAAVVLTSFSLGLFRFYRTFLRRIPEAINVRPSYFQKRSLLGKVTSVGDGDNFRIYHTPGGWLAGWGWLPWRRIPKDRKELKNKTIHVRLAGVDAPELAHFGRPSQPYAQEALDWLTSYVLGRRIRAYVHKPDQYSRVVATAYVWKGFLRRDIGLQMLRAGMATVYEAKTGVEFREGLEQKYRNAEWWAKMKRKGIWASSKKDFESPREYKTRHGTRTAIDEETAVKKG